MGRLILNSPEVTITKHFFSSIGHPGEWRNVKLGDSDLDGGRAYQVTDDTVSVLVDHF